MQKRLKDILKNIKSIVIISGISASGKTTLAHKIQSQTGYDVLSLDDYKVKWYEKYGFMNEFERKNLWNMAKYEFQADIIQSMRNGINIIVEYTFDKTWQEFFDLASQQYGYKTIVINCDSRKFDDIWKSRVSRDSDSSQRPICLTAKVYEKGKRYESNGKLCEEYKETKHKDYIQKKYSSLHGNYVFRDNEVK